MNAFDELAVAESERVIDELGQWITFQSATVGSRRVKAIFDSAADIFDDGSVSGVVRARAELHLKSSDVTPQEGDTALIDSALFVVQAVIPDDAGVTRCLMAAQ